MAEIYASGGLQKMQTTLNTTLNSQSTSNAADKISLVNYQLPVGEQVIAMNPLLGKTIKMVYSGAIFCQHCHRKTKTSFNQGYCYPCFKKLAQCDSCIMSPEKCHYFEGTCREPEWGEKFCMQDHYVYLANSSGVKVGITRGSQIPTRWMDQGAIQALPIFRVSNRLQSGQVEVMFKEHVADKTNWRKMLKGEVETIDLLAKRDELVANCTAQITDLQAQFGLQAIKYLDDAEPIDIHYPVVQHPVKVTSMNFDKQPVIEGVLKGIKGQYLMLDCGVINMRKFSAYHIDFSVVE